jgi:hypothetical protein
VVLYKQKGIVCMPKRICLVLKLENILTNKADGLSLILPKGSWRDLCSALQAYCLLLDTELSVIYQAEIDVSQLELLKMEFGDDLPAYREVLADEQCLRIDKLRPSSLGNLLRYVLLTLKTELDRVLLVDASEAKTSAAGTEELINLSPAEKYEALYHEIVHKILTLLEAGYDNQALAAACQLLNIRPEYAALQLAYASSSPLNANLKTSGERLQDDLKGIGERAADLSALVASVLWRQATPVISAMARGGATALSAAAGFVDSKLDEIASAPKSTEAAQIGKVYANIASLQTSAPAPSPVE